MYINYCKLVDLQYPQKMGQPEFWRSLSHLYCCFEGQGIQVPGQL